MRQLRCASTPDEETAGAADALAALNTEAAAAMLPAPLSGTSGGRGVIGLAACHSKSRETGYALKRKVLMIIQYVF